MCVLHTRLYFFEYNPYHKTVEIYQHNVVNYDYIVDKLKSQIYTGENA